MFTELIPLSFEKIMQTHAYTMIVFTSDVKKFAIYVAPSVGKALQNYLTHKEAPRPLTHDFISSLFQGLEIEVIQVVITNVEETIYFARIFLEQKRGDMGHIVEIDARPSDAIMVALMHNAPVFCSKEMMDKAIPVME